MSTIGAAALTLAMAAPAAAAERCWDDAAPATGGGWNTAANWSGGVVPEPGDTVAFNFAGGGCSTPANVVLSGANASVALVRQASTTIVLDGSELTLTGVANATQILGSLDALNGGSLKIAVGAEIYAGGIFTLGNPGNGSVVIQGTLRAFTGALSVDEPAGGGLLSIAPGGSLIYNPGNTGTLRSRLDNDGTIALLDDGTSSAFVLAYPSSGSPQSDGDFTISPLSTLALRPTRGSTMVAAGAISGAGKLEINASEGIAMLGTVAVPAAASLDVGRLTIGSPSALDLAANGSAGELLMASANGADAGGRFGAGTLTAGIATINGGHLAGGLTKITGATTINGGFSTPAIHNGATLRTEGATTWPGGGVTLGAPGEPGTWVNAGTLTINNANQSLSLQLVKGSDTGVLRNLAGATINRGAPAGIMYGAARIENAGTVNVLAGTMGQPTPFTTGDFVQSNTGLTTVATGATLSLNTTLNGGTLRGAGTVRRLSNPGGTVEPGASPGTLTITEDFTQGPGGTLQEEIAGPATAQFDRLVVGGLATLGGTLAIANDAGYSPAQQSTYKVVQSATRVGQFAALTGAQVGGSSYVDDYLSDGAQLCFGFSCPGAVPATFQLTVTLSGAGSGSVTSDVSGIACAPDCAETYAAGATVTLTAQPTGGSTFTGWSGICEGLAPCVVTMSEARNVTATFAAPAIAPNPPPAPSPTPAAPEPLPRIEVAGIIAFPSTRRCVSRRSFRIRLRVPRGLTAKSARVVVDGKQVKVLRGSRLTAPVDLRTLPRGRFKVEITISLADGRTIRDSRRYRTCAPKSRR